MSRAGGSVAVIEVALLTVNALDGSTAEPTCTETTLGTPPDSNPVPVMWTVSPPAVLPDDGLSPETTGRLSFAP